MAYRELVSRLNMKTYNKRVVGCSSNFHLWGRLFIKGLNDHVKFKEENADIYCHLSFV